MDASILIRIRHRDIDPDKLTEVFGMEPEYSWQAGEPRPESESGATRRESYWVAEVPLRHRLPEEVMQTMGAARSDPIMPVYNDQAPLERSVISAALLFRKNGEFWDRLKSDGATAQLIVTLGPDSMIGLELSEGSMAMLSRLGLSLSVGIRDVEEEEAAA